MKFLSSLLVVGSLFLTGCGMTSELVIKDLKVGEGDEVQVGDVVEVHYVGTLDDGTKFDSSWDRGATFSFELGSGQVIEGWDKGVVGMRVGGIRQLTIPSSMAYGAAGIPGVIPENATLNFDVELIAID